MLAEKRSVIGSRVVKLTILHVPLRDNSLILVTGETVSNSIFDA